MVNEETILKATVSNSIRQEMSDGGEIVGGRISNGLVSLKRKRPLKIEIPTVLSEIPVDVFKESGGRRKGDDPVSFADYGVGVYSSKGKKKFMEDSHKVYSSENGDKRFFGVYDGHGGSKAAEFVAENLHLRIFDMLEKNSENKEKEAACKAGYLKADEEFLKQGLDSGACCVTALIDGEEMVVSNLGDCRAVLCMRNGSAEALTTDHRPTREEERRRIEDKGGYVEIHRGTWRVHGTLAVSRSIGDSHLKDWVMAEPETKVICLNPDMKYLILASDGLWEQVNNEEAVDVVMRSLMTRSRSCANGSPPAKFRRISLVKRTKMKTCLSSNENEALNERPPHSRLLTACKKLAELAVDRGSLDDITVMIIDLNLHSNTHEPIVVS